MRDLDLRLLRFACAWGLLTAAAACGGSAGPQAPQTGPPPMPVETVVLSERVLDHSSDFVAALRSQRSSTIQPQVEGLLTRVAVRPGQPISRGTVLFEVDSGPQQAAIAALESMRVSRDAELTFARRQAERTRTLLGVGAVSQRDLEEAETNARMAEAAANALDEQIRQQRAEFAYYRVTSPVAGIVGDIPVREGERVTTSTVLTTVDENQALEMYINVPVGQAPDLALGLPVQIIGEQGAVLATNPVSFVSSTVEPTQTVLARVALVDGRGQFRSEQFVRARIVWRSAPGLTVPVTAVTRVNGQFFVFVVDAQGDATVARQRPVTLGDLIGNDYVVVSGLTAGEQLVVGGVQKIAEGAPVSATLAPVARPPSAAQGSTTSNPTGAPAEKKAP